MKSTDKYLQGKENWGIRMYFYLNSGLTIANNFRNLILGVFALYFTLKLTNPLWLVIMFASSVPILVLIGHYNVHKMAKITEWLSIKFSTHYGIKQFTFIEQQVKLLTKIYDTIRAESPPKTNKHTQIIKTGKRQKSIEIKG